MILSAKNNPAQSFLSPDLELGRKGSISSRVSGYEIGTLFFLLLVPLLLTRLSS